MTTFYLLCLFTRSRWVVKKGQNSVYVYIEWPQKTDVSPLIMQLDIEDYLEHAAKAAAKKCNKGPFNNYVNRILTFFDHPPTPSKQT